MARGEHRTILLSTGNVLAFGGVNINGVSAITTELYNPLTGKWTFTGKMNVGRSDFGMAMLFNGKVLASGGTNVTLTTNTVLGSAELYDPSTGALDQDRQLEPRPGLATPRLCCRQDWCSMPRAAAPRKT